MQVLFFLRTCCCFTCVYNVVFLDCFLPEERVGRLLRKLKWDYESDRYRATWKPVGKGKVSEVPRQIAWWNDIPKAELYTVHSFRRTTAASKMAENGATILEIMLAGGWKSDKIARTYVEKSLRTKVIFFIHSFLGLH